MRGGAGGFNFSYINLETEKKRRGENEKIIHIFIYLRSMLHYAFTNVANNG